MAKKPSSKAPTNSPAQAAAAEGSAPWKMLTGKIADKGMNILTAPPIVPLKDMPIGAALDGVIKGVLPSRSEDIKNPLIVMDIDGNEFSVPAQAVIAGILLPDYDEKNPTHRSDPAQCCPYIGHRCVIKRTGTKDSKKWKQDDGVTARKFALYDIAVSPKPVV